MDIKHENELRARVEKEFNNVKLRDLKRQAEIVWKHYKDYEEELHNLALEKARLIQISKVGIGNNATDWYYFTIG